jgi:hypothetical protein
MASDVDICNDALAMLGDEATVASIDPPEGSAQADHCARFYPKARDSLLEMHQWGFATVRANLALLAVTPPSTWLYAYAAPTDALNLISVLAPDAGDDDSVQLGPYIVTSTLYTPDIVPVAGNGVGLYTPQPFVNETLADGTQVIYTNQPNAVLRYTRTITDPTQFSPLFTEALTVLLASKLAGPVIKGSEGRAAAAALRSEFAKEWFPRAVESDANQRYTQVAQQVPWVTGR